MLCGSLKSNGLADPFKNNEDDTFPEEQLPPYLQEHSSAVDQPPRKGRQNEMAPAPEGLARAVHSAGYQSLHMPQVQQPASSQQLHFPSYLDMWPAHAAAMSQALGANARFNANGTGIVGMRHLHQNSNAGCAPAAAAFGVDLPDYHAAGLLQSQPVSNGFAATAAAASDAVTNPSLPPDSSSGLQGSMSEAAATAVPTVSQEASPASQAQQPPALQASLVAPQASTTVADTGTMHRPMQYPTPPGSLPLLLHPSLPLGAAPASASTAATLSSSFPGSFLFPSSAPAADAFAPADMTRLAQSQLGWYAQHLPPSSLNGYLPAPFVLNTHQVPFKTQSPAAVDANGLSPAAAGSADEAGRKRKSPGSSQKKGLKTGGVTGGPVIAKRAANRPPPQVKLQLTIYCVQGSMTTLQGNDAVYMKLISESGGYSTHVLSHVCDCTAAAVCASSRERALSVFVPLLALVPHLSWSTNLSKA